MARLRQLHPGNYRSSGNIQDDIENIIRYINSAEHGDATVGELLAKLFDADGIFDGPVEMRYDGSLGFQYRIGEYDGAEDGWSTLMTVAQLKGDAGTSVGTIEGEIFHNRTEELAVAAQTLFSYTWEATEDVIVFKDGLIQIEGAGNDYVANQGAGTITFNTPMAGGEKITLITVRAGAVSNYRRSDQTSAAGQAVFPFVHTSAETLLVYLNGVLQEPGGANDYTNDPASDTITFTSSLALNDKVVIITVENLALQSVTGLMLESAYTDGTGKVPYNKLSIADDDIPQAKVDGLVALLTDRGRMTVDASAPVSPSAGDQWLDTSVSPNVLKIYDGVNWLNVDAGGDVPTFSAADAKKQLHVNGTGTDVEWANYDDSHLVPKTFMAAANGVATLDGSGSIPIAQLPETFAQDTLYHKEAGAVANGTYTMRFIFKQKIRIDGIVTKLSAGTCTVQLSVDGGLVGVTQAVTTTKADSTFGATIEVDGSSTSKTLEITVTSSTGATDLEIGLPVVSVTA